MVIADSGFFVALLRPVDHAHLIAKRLYDELDEPIVTTWPVLTEATHILASRAHPGYAIGLMESIASAEFRLATQGQDDSHRMAHLMQKYHDFPMDLADASLVVLAEKLGNGRILSTDRRDFKSYKWKNRKPFTNLMFPND
ncbi:MAG: PIN domain-containing protein [Betaproteobacteria bacterium]|nr:PIN domain-containing protein [Betaproteobacteria bacterium]